MGWRVPSSLPSERPETSCLRSYKPTGSSPAEARGPVSICVRIKIRIGGMGDLAEMAFNPRLAYKREGPCSNRIQHQTGVQLPTFCKKGAISL